MPALERIATAVLTLCAVIVTALVIRRELVAPPLPPVLKPRSIERWRAIAAEGRAMGPAGAKVLVTEFSDFQCPYCRAVQPALKALRSRFPGDAAVVYRHYPLATHPFAYEAALAAECAGAQGRFEPYHDLLFSSQESLGVVSWGHLAALAGVPDTAALMRCVRDRTPAWRVDRDISVARELHLLGTPSIMVNETLLGGTPSYSELESRVKALLGERR